MSKNCFIKVVTTGFPQRKGFDNYYDPKNYNYYNDSRIIELGFSINDEINTNIIYPNFKIENEEIHGISQEYAQQIGRNIIDVLDEFEHSIENIDLFISYNINFDINILLAECYRYERYSLIEKIKNIDRYCLMKYGKNIFGVYVKFNEFCYYLLGERIQNSFRVEPYICLVKKCFEKVKKNS